MPQSPWVDLNAALHTDGERPVWSRIGSDAVLEGDLICTAGRREGRGDVIAVNGKVRGAIRGFDAVVIEPQADLEGTVESNIVVINGGIRGRIEAPRRVEIQAKARFFGDLAPMPDVLVLSPQAVFGRDEQHTDPLTDDPSFG